MRARRLAVRACVEVANVTAVIRMRFVGTLQHHKRGKSPWTIISPERAMHSVKKPSHSHTRPLELAPEPTGREVLASYGPSSRVSARLMLAAAACARNC